MTVYALIALVSFLGGILSGVAGFGALILIVPALIFLVGMTVAIPLSILCGIVTQGANALDYHDHVPKKDLLRMLAGSLPGIWLGSTLLISLPEVVLRAALGLLIVGYVAWTLGTRHRPARAPSPAPAWAYLTGFLSGGFGAAFGINGPPAVVYATRTNWPPEAIRAFLGLFCTLLFGITALTMIARGLMPVEVWKLAAPAIPACLAGSRCGRRAAARLQPAQYMRVVLLILLLMGLSLCWPAFRLYVLPA